MDKSLDAVEQALASKKRELSDLVQRTLSQLEMDSKECQQPNKDTTWSKEEADLREHLNSLIEDAKSRLEAVDKVKKERCDFLLKSHQDRLKKLLS